jgi:hypothetical protein
MGYDVGASLGNILDGNRPTRERAVLLFEFYAALLHCKGAAPKSPGFSIIVPEKRLREARLFAIMKLAEHDDERAGHAHARETSSGPQPLAAGRRPAAGLRGC